MARKSKIQTSLLPALLRNPKSWAAAALFAASLLAPQGFDSSNTAKAAGSTHVRVLLLAKTSSFNTSRDSVTFTAKSNGFQVGFDSGNGYSPLLSIASGSSLLSSLDDYFLIAQETDTYTTAAASAAKLQAAGYSSGIILQTRQGKKIYQVVQGYYEQLSDAQSASTAVAGLGFQPKLAGFYRLSAGSFATVSDANAKITAIQNLGIDAYLTGKVSPSGTVTYEVWIGDAASASDRDALGAALKGKGIAASPVSFSDHYAVLKPDVTMNGSDGSPITNWHSYSESTGQELKLVPQGSPGIIWVQEKGIAYRGNLIVRGYRSRLAVVNDISVDDYVRGVVPKEMASGWPIEALKAQAVAARTYVMKQPADNWSIAAVDDSTYSQAYGGYTAEADDTNAAVDQTSGQVLMYDNGTPNDTSDDVLVDTLFSANHGGRSADPSEVWGNPVPYLTSVDSSYDQASEDYYHEPIWDHIMFSNGMVGYVRSDFLTATGSKTQGNLPYATVNTDGANIRAIPDIVNGKIIGTTHQGDTAVILDTTREYDPYSWMKGPFSASDMQNLLGTSSPVTSLTIGKVGPSGRPLQIFANGALIPVNVPDDYRGIFGTISNLFTIEQTGSYTVKGASASADYPSSNTSGQALAAVGAAGTGAVNNGNSSFVILGANGANRVATVDPAYVIHGNGSGHGLGMSQWGAYGMAQAGYNYQDILRHYYTSHVYLKTVQ